MDGTFIGFIIPGDNMKIWFSRWRCDAWLTAKGDINGGGNIDIAVNNYDEIGTIFLRHTAGTFVDSDVPGGDDGTWSTAQGNISADGNIDIIVGNWY